MTDATLPHPYARDVAGAIDGKGPDDPASLWQLHQAIDWRERDEIDVEALNAILGWLVASGRIRELPGHRYVDAVHAAGRAEPSPVTAAEWAEARAEYRDRFARAYAELRE